HPSSFETRPAHPGALPGAGGGVQPGCPDLRPAPGLRGGGAVHQERPAPGRRGDGLPRVRGADRLRPLPGARRPARRPARGAPHLLTVLVLGWSLTVGAVALTANLPPGSWVAFACLAVLQFLFASFQAGGFPVLARVVADWMPTRQRGLAQGAVWMCSRLGG